MPKKSKYVTFSDTMKKIWELEQQGMNGKQIAEQLKVSQGRICNLRTSDVYKNNTMTAAKAEANKKEKNIIRAQRELVKEVTEIRQQVIREEVKKSIDPVIVALRESALPAAEEIIRLSTQAKKEDTRFHASVEILDRAGYIAEKKTVTRTIEVSSEDAEKIAESIKYVETRTLETVL